MEGDKSQLRAITPRGMMGRLLMGGLIIAGMLAAIRAVDANVLLCIVIWLIPTILGSIGVFLATGSKTTMWPNAAVAAAMVAVTPGLFLNLIPNPLLLMVITADVPGWSRMPVRTTVGILLILLIGAVVASVVAALGNRVVRRCVRGRSNLMRAVVSFSSFLLMLLIYHLISPLILAIVYFLGVYSEIGVFF